jgi:phage-related protein
VAAAIDKGRVSTPESVLILLKIMVAPGVYVRVVRNNSDVAFDAGDGFGSQTFTAFPFELDVVEETSQGQLPSVNLKVSNVNLALQALMETYDGGVGSTITMYVVDTANPTGESDLSMVFQATEAFSDPNWITFTLGAESPLRRLFPRFLFIANHCIWLIAYKGENCLYAGGLASCDGTLDGPNGCRVHANQGRYGGVPGVDSAGFRGASSI